MGIVGRSIGPWGTMSVLAGAAVLIPSAVALLFSLAAVLSDLF